MDTLLDVLVSIAICAMLIGIVFGIGALMFAIAGTMNGACVW